MGEIDDREKSLDVSKPPEAQALRGVKKWFFAPKYRCILVRGFEW